MSTKTRKQKILGDVKKKRRQRTLVSYIVVAILIAIVTGGVYAVVYYPRDYIFIPGGIGFSNTCARPVHTHDSSGTIHVETDVNRNYTVGDFFLIWGKVFNGSGIFPSTQPLPSYLGCVTGNLLYHSHPSLTIRPRKDFPPSVINMTVNGLPTAPNPDPNLQLPRNAATAAAPCTPGPCAPFAILIQYGPGVPASF